MNGRQNYFISIHANANLNPAINGTEVYIYQYYTQANWLAEQVMDGVTQMTGTKNNGISRKQIIVFICEEPLCLPF